MRFFDAELQRPKGPVIVRVGFTVERSAETGFQPEVTLQCVEPDLTTTPEEDESLRDQAYAYHLKQ